jgi:hypothetical protein
VKSVPQCAHLGIPELAEVNEDIPDIQDINVWYGVIHEPRWLSRYSDWAASWATKESGIIPGRGKRFYSSLHRPGQLLGPPTPPRVWVPGAVSAAIKRPVR